MMLSPLTIAILSVATLTFWGLSLFLIRASAISMFRYKLWELRDIVVDAIIHGELPNSSGVNEFVTTVEGTIQRAESVTLLKWIMLPSPPEDLKRKHQSTLEATIAGMTASQKEFFERRIVHFQHAVVQHLACASLFGLITVAIFGAGFTVIGLVNRIVAPIKYAKNQIVSVAATTDRICSFLDSSGPPSRHPPLSMCQ